MNKILGVMALTMIGMAGVATAAPLTFFGEDSGIFLQSGAPTGAPRTNADAANAAFLSNLVGVGTETFESFADGTGAPLALVFPGAGSATLNGGGAVDDDPGTGQNAISGTKWWRTGAGNDFTITFSSAVAAFGFYGIDVGDIGAQLTLTLASGGSVSIAIPHTIGTGQNGSVIYFGYIDTAAPFTSATFSNPSSGDDFGFDNMTIGSVQQVVQVPEPGTIALVGGALLGLAGVRRRRHGG